MHIPVLLKEVLDGLDLKPGDVVVDGTVGGGGYLFEISKIIGDKGTIIGIDQDSDALERAGEKLANYSGVRYFARENFRNLDKVLNDLKIEKVDGIVFDLGLSSIQLEETGRGFTFQKDEPLLMTFKKDPDDDDLTAKEIVNYWEEGNIADIIYGFGEEKFAKRIAKNIVEKRREKPINTTFELVDVIKDSVPSWYRRGRTHFATKTFQAFRIVVNDEIGSLQEGIGKGFDFLNIGGRMAVVSFHSIEDRVVKNLFRDKEKEGVCKKINKKPITPSYEEVKNNSRSRSAKLRIVEKLF